MRSYLLKHAALLLVVTVVMGCAMMKPPLERDERYPAGWQDMASLGPECTGLEGVYSNEGMLFDSKGRMQTVQLTDILPVKVEGKPENIYVKAVTQRIDSNGDTIAKLEIHVDDDNKGLKKCQECEAYCIKHALFFVSKMDYISIPYLSFYGKQQNVWLTKDKDGTLVAKIWDYGVGFLAIMPLHKHPSNKWARFKRICD